MRTFVAIALPDAARSALGGHLARCAEAAPGFRWVEPAGLHVTLRFVGPIGEAAQAALVASLAEVRAAPLELRVGPGGAFGGPHRARVIWFAVLDRDGALQALAARCEAACRAAGLAPEARPYRPHVTLARSRSRAGSPLPGLPIPPRLEPWRADEFILYESRARSGRSPEYVPVERFRLRA